MNERIRELALEADLITHKVPNGLAHLHTEKDLEKFAQSIVRACVTKMALEIMDEQWVDDAVKNTYAHFGVEEQTASQKMAAAGYTRRPRGWTKEGTE